MPYWPAPHTDGRGKHAERARIPAEPFCVDRGEQGHGQAEDGGGEIGEKRAGRSTASSEDCTATRAYSSQGSRSPAKAWAANAADTAARQLLVTSRSLRRSTASAAGPPSSPAARVGTICATPMAP